MDQQVFDIIEKASNGDAAAQYAIGAALSADASGDIEEAIVWLTKSAEQGFSDAQARLGTLYLEAEAKDLNKAKRWLKLASDSGDLEAKKQYSRLINADSDTIKFKEALTLAQRGDAQAQYQVATMFEKGIGVRADLTSAEYWYEEFEKNSKRELNKEIESQRSMDAADNETSNEPTMQQRKVANMNINSYIKNNIASVFNNSKKIHIAPSIPEKKINKAVNKFKFDGNVNTIVALVDNTLFGSGADGLLFTGERVVYHAAFSNPISLTYKEIFDVKHVVEVATDKKGSEKKKEHISVSRSGHEPVKLHDLIDCDYEKLASFLKCITTDVDEYKEEDQLQVISDLSEALKIAYLQIVVNMAFADDGVVDEKEFSEILQLMTRLNLASESRNKVRSYIANSDNLAPLSGLMAELDNECPESQKKATHISLVKDLISIYKSVSDAPLESFEFFKQNRSLFDVPDEEVELAVMAIENDRKMLSGDYDDTMIEKSVKELAAKSAAVGVPLGAVYLSGSVVGMSAAGLTSGLATIGFGGALGLSSMATGIGVAVLLGIGAYKGMKVITGANELDKNKRRALMLQDVIKQTQRAITDVGYDINYLTDKLNNYITKAQAAEHKDPLLESRIEETLSTLNLYSKSSVRLSGKTTTAYDETQKLRCPAVLNMTRLESLTQEATKKPIYQLAMASYVESPSKDESSDTGTEFRLKSSLSTQQLENLASAFEAIGYFDTASVAMGAIGDGVDKAKDKIRGIFS
nr:hypothetical protein [uncultured Pseudodesulfovibrio sp.]